MIELSRTWVVDKALPRREVRRAMQVGPDPDLEVQAGQTSLLLRHQSYDEQHATQRAAK